MIPEGPDAAAAGPNQGEALVAFDLDELGVDWGPVGSDR